MSAVCFAVSALLGVSFGVAAGGAGTTDANPSLRTTSVSAGGRFEAFALLGMLLNSNEGRPSAMAMDATSAAATPTKRGIQTTDCGRAAPNFFLISAISGMKVVTSGAGVSEGGGSEASTGKAGAGAGLLIGAAMTGAAMIGAAVIGAAAIGAATIGLGV